MPTGVYERTPKTRAAIAESVRGRKMSPESSEKKRLAMTGLKRLSQRGELHQDWKGDAACVRVKHIWADRHFGKTGTCQHCNEHIGTVGSTGTQWASIGHTYTREREDWLELCRRCHEAFDRKDRQ